MPWRHLVTVLRDAECVGQILFLAYAMCFDDVMLFDDFMFLGALLVFAEVATH